MKPLLHLIFIWLSITALSAQVTITEFVADNDGSFLDEDGDASDWIELHNAGAESVSLAGYFLSDSSTDLDRWMFPDVEISPGSYLVIFASAKDRALAGSELHTNFSLSSDGEFLGLVSPNGQAILSSFGQRFPQQFHGMSYGVGVDASTLQEVGLVPLPSAANWFIPISDIGETWQEVGFDDSAWNTGETGIGFGYDEPGFVGAGGDTRSQMRFNSPSAYVRIPFQIDDPASVASMTLSAYFDDGFVAYLNGEEVARENVSGVVNYDSLSDSATEVDSTEPMQAFPLSFAGRLVTGENILGIHLVNSSFAGNDAVIVPTLAAQINTENTPITGYLGLPTPGDQNAPVIASDFVRDTSFDVDRGFFEAPFTVNVSTSTLGSTIVYTTDGSTPSLSNGTPVSAASPTEPPVATVTISSTTTLRATAFLDGSLPSNTDTQTYLFLDDVLDQPSAPEGYPFPWVGRDGVIGGDYDMSPEIVGPVYSREELKLSLTDLPTISIVTEIANLFDPEIGIQVNPRDDGPESEREVSVEMFGFENGEPLQLNAGMLMNGNASRNPNRPKHNFRLAFRGIYGAGRLDFPLFGENASSETFNQIILRGGNGNSWLHPSVFNNSMYIRDQWFRDSFSAMGYPEAQQREVHVYFNGLYWGVHHLFERIEEEWAAERFGGEEEDWEAFRIVGGNTIEIISGTEAEEAAGILESWQTVLDAAEAGDLVMVEEYFDLDHFIDYVLLNFHGGNDDWDQNNVRALRRTNPPGKYQFFSHDAERAGLNALNSNGINIDLTTRNTVNGPTQIHTALRNLPEYALRFADRAQRHLFEDGGLTAENGAALWAARAAGIREALKAESARWGDFRGSPPRTLETWETALQREYTQWFPFRTAVTISQLRATGIYPDIEPPQFNQHGGLIMPGFAAQLTSPAGDIYYTADGSDPRLTGGGVNPNAILVSSSITIPETMLIRARSFDGSEWSALIEATFLTGVPATSANLIISELFYNPAGTDEAGEFIEIMNIGDEPVNLSGVAFTGGIAFSFGATDFLGVGQRLILTAAEYEGQLSNGGETITLSADDVIIQSFRYDDSAPWPVRADGEGFSLTLIAPESAPDLSNPANWRSSVSIGGSPAGSDASPFLGSTEAELLEYALGSADARISGSIETLEVDGVIGSYFVTQVPRVLAADDVIFSIEFSDDLDFWEAGTEVFLGNRQTNSVSALSSWRPVNDINSGPRFARLILQLRAQ